MDDFQSLWDGSDPVWVLEDVYPERSGWERYAIRRSDGEAPIIIDDDEAYRRVIEKMLSANVQILPYTPSSVVAGERSPKRRR